MDNKCLVSFYQKNKWVEDCALYYTVEQKMSFEEAARSLIRSMSYAKERLDYFELLVGNDNQTGKMYGNHQIISSPIANKTIHDLIEDNRIFNNYGYDVQKWNEQHCSINTDKHEGIDIICSMNEEILSPVDGKITKVTDNSVEITSDKIDFWYEESTHKIVVTIDNLQLSANLSAGSEIKTGDVIGTPTPNHRCGDLDNIKNVSSRYIHLAIKVDYYGLLGGKYIDPRIIMD